MSALFTLPAAWRTPADGDHHAEVGLAGGLPRLADACGAEPGPVLLAAHLKVLSMLSEEPVFDAEVTGGPDAATARYRAAATWRELVTRTATTAAHAGADAPRPADRVLFGLASTGPEPVGQGFGLVVTATGDGLRIRARGVAPDYVEGLAAMYRAVLTAMAADPGGDARAAYLPPDERRAVLGTWSTGPVSDRGAHTTAALVAAQAARTPGAIAVRLAGAALTYRELDERANRIAHHLLALGARPESLVGVCLRRTADLLPALLGVWRAGAAFLPLDPDLPPARLRVLVQGAASQLVVTAGGGVPDLGGGCRLIRLDDERAAIDTRPPSPPPVAADPRRLAYVMYTSGSTGAPKGVMVTQAGLANYLLWTVEAYAARGGGGSAFFSSIGFDLGLPSLLTPLLTGQAVHLLPDPLSLAELGDLLAAGAPYAFLKMTPGHLDLLSLDLTAEQIHGLAGIVVAAGDAFTRELAQRWIDFAGPGGTVVGTEYGPTEITIGNSGCPVTEPPATDLVPLGVPIPNTTMYVLTERLEPVPVGVPGEVYVGGAGVARGYLGRPALTAERFLPDPYGPPGSRLYRTGDQARWRPDGTLEFLGRLDHQVKIRGYRIELGEIQARLRGHPHVEEVVADACGEGSNRALAAFVVPAAGCPVDPAALRAHVAAALPGHMVPEIVIAVDRIPLTANGKVDRGALRRRLAPQPSTPA
ncbi:amino acid adenylation domain-containing protein [Dactylosporangium sp. CA-139114]|uniref:amino acid adenylation domain-containing protein n=1 Tax=Dactylosporangium sp. CA-139114 TaxID=3239931 RepID=UPI003D9510E4